MTGKLVRNLSDKQSREWWTAIEAAARTAPKLDSERRPFPKAAEPKPARSHRRETTKK